MTRKEFEEYVTNDLEYNILFDPIDNEIVLLFNRHFNEDLGIFIGHPMQAVAEVQYINEDGITVQASFIISLTRSLSSTYELYTVVENGGLTMVDRMTMQPSLCYLGAQPENKYVYLFFANRLLDQYLTNTMVVTDIISC